MNEQAVAPVVAMMLIIAVLVTFISVVNTSVIPAFKQQAEVEHIMDVEAGISAFASDIETAAASGQPVHLSETIPLGGGAVILDPLRSAGTLQVVAEDEWVAEIGNASGNGSLGRVNLIAFGYSPVSSFWRDQGYVWRFGCVNVTSGQGGITGAARQTPLHFATVEEAAEYMNGSAFPAALIRIEDTGVWTNTSSPNRSTWRYICTNLTIRMVTCIPGESRFVSGNDRGLLVLDSMVDEREYPAESRISVRVNRNLPINFNYPLERAVSERLRKLADRYDNLSYDYVESTGAVTCTLIADSPVGVTFRKITLTVQAV